MPIYEFRCKDCGYEFEALCGSNNERPDCCPECKAQELKKLLSTFSAKGPTISSGDGSCSDCSSTSCDTCS
ncbi:FmdB family zinc ribbon protein [Sporohalobacter salinus]|uniref:FmdB family zinc ribbon protein n=1 Tax=Sporohalobacter salinus TaxID=1494606 RepID=UPI0019603BB3|nr:zinc ribbon domain-containing protein [Sporohalobacter salinus]MBM7622551.1 putative FmdB family regulatory protein [Sporohalobacter salinus]